MENIFYKKVVFKNNLFNGKYDSLMENMILKNGKNGNKKHVFKNGKK